MAFIKHINVPKLSVSIMHEKIIKHILYKVPFFRSRHSSSYFILYLNHVAQLSNILSKYILYTIPLDYYL